MPTLSLLCLTSHFLSLYYISIIHLYVYSLFHFKFQSHSYSLLSVFPYILLLQGHQVFSPPRATKSPLPVKNALLLCKATEWLGHTNKMHMTREQPLRCPRLTRCSNVPNLCFPCIEEAALTATSHPA